MLSVALRYIYIYIYIYLRWEEKYKLYYIYIYIFKTKFLIAHVTELSKKHKWNMAMLWKILNAKSNIINLKVKKNSNHIIYGFDMWGN